MKLVRIRALELLFYVIAGLDLFFFSINEHFVGPFCVLLDASDRNDEISS